MTNCTPRTRAARIRSLALAIAATGTLVLTSGLNSPANAQRPASDSAKAPCIGNDSARVKSGYQGVDPNSVTAAQAGAIERQLARRAAKMTTAQRAVAKATTITVPVHWHVILKKNGTGGVTNAQIQAQLQVLNDGYGGLTSSSAYKTQFQFSTKSIDRTKNTNWYNWANPDVNVKDDNEAKSALGIKPRTELNVYIANLGDGLLGYASFPWTTDIGQGVVILNESLPGGTAAPYNEGDTLTHEAGHWFGLYHTFQDGCVPPGDYVDDTPAQFDGVNIFECDASANTCPAPGKDPVHNFMAYGDDPCLTQFTEGQSDRMSAFWPLWRGPAS